MLSFIKKYVNLPYLAALIIATIFSFIVPMFITVDFNAFDGGSFFLLIILGWMPYFVLIGYGYKLRCDIQPDLTLGFGKYLGTSILGSLLVGLCALPVVGIFMFFMFKVINLGTESLVNQNFILNIVYLPFFYPVFIASTGAFVRILGKMEAGFKFSDIPVFLKSLLLNQLSSHLL
jgi:hypothetical protein